MERISQLVSSLETLVNQELGSCRSSISSLLDTLQSMQSASGDRRLVLLAAQFRKLRERLELLTLMIRDDYLEKIRKELGPGRGETAVERTLAIIESLAAVRPPSLGGYCDVLLDRLVESTGAERGFVLFYVPESTEADVVATRNFETSNLSLGEYGFSRTIIRQVLDSREPLMLDDAAANPKYGREVSIHRLSLRSVLAVPLASGSRATGAIYLENNSAPKVFSSEDAQVAEMAARFAALHLSAAHLLPGLERDGQVLLDASRAFSEIVGNDPAIHSILATVERIADSPATVLIEGESGTGKELIARALHYRSARRERAFVAINCAAIPEQLLESELFGHERGAFTGAVDRRLGMFERGAGGTVFLDEISELAYGLQAKLLRFLQSHELQRLGGSEILRPDVRMVVATSKDLRALMRAGSFQEALYYRIHVVPIVLPPLRSRRGDIVVLIEHFLERFSAMYGRRVRVDSDALACLADYEWPGNVRELENIVHRVVALARDDVVRVGDLPVEIIGDNAARVTLAGRRHVEPVDIDDLRRQRDAARLYFAGQERRIVEEAVRLADGNVTEAAARLGMHRVTLHRILRTKQE